MVNNSYVRTYVHNVIKLTDNKRTIVNKLLVEYRRVANIMVNKHMRNMFETGQLSTKAKDFYGDIQTFMTERYKDVIKRQVDGMMNSYISNCKNKFESIVRHSTLNKETKTQLYEINKENLWFEKENQLARKIFKEVLKQNNLPSTNGINMVLNTKVYLLEENVTTESCTYHILLSTSTGRGERIDIGLLPNSRFDKILKNHTNKPRINNSITLNFDKENNLKSISLTLTFTRVESVEHYDKSIAMDFGVKNLFTTSSGNIYGKNFIKKLGYYDNQRLKLEKELKKRNKNYSLKTNKRYNKIVSKTKDYIKNETNRVLNNIVHKEKISELVVEKLVFRSTNLSKRMNRLISNCGLGNIDKKLNSLCEELGLKVIKVNSAFTSQECNNCGYVHKKNRPTRDEFSCVCCGKKEKSDIKSAKTILRRSKDGWFNSKLNKYANVVQIKQELSLRFLNTKRGRFFSESALSCTKVG